MGDKWHYGQHEGLLCLGFVCFMVYAPEQMLRGQLRDPNSDSSGAVLRD